MALLRSPHFALHPSHPAALGAIAGIDRGLSAARYLGELDRLREVADQFTDPDVVRLLRSIVAAAERLQPLLERAPASAQTARLVEFLKEYRRPPGSDRERRGHAAIVGILE